MGFKLTERARIEADKVNKEPQLVFEIDGVNTVYGAVILKKYIRVGDDDLLIGNDWRIGGLNEIEDSSPYITFTRGTSTSISQKIDQDKGETSTISSLDISLIDKNNEITQLLKPDDSQSPVFDLLGRKCTIWLGFAESGWKTDYIKIFRGFIQDYEAGAGFVKFNISSIENIAKSEVLPKVETELSVSLGSGAVTSVSVDSTENFSDSKGITKYIRIDDEIIRYQNIGSTGSFTTSLLDRAQLGTVAVSHDVNATVESFYSITDSPFDMALNLLMSSSGTNTKYYASGVPITNLVRLGDNTTDSRSLFVRGVNLVEEYGVRVNDVLNVEAGVACTQTAQGNVVEVNVFDDGSTQVRLDSGAVINGNPSGTFTEELDVDCTFKIRSDYANEYEFGLGLTPNEVDIDSFEKLRNRFFGGPAGTTIEKYVKDTLNVREFIEQEIFKPLSLYAVPRKGKISVKYHFPPLPDEQVPILNSTNIVDPASIKIKRSTATNFYNAVAIKFDEQALEEKFDKGVLSIQADSTERIPVGTKTFRIDSTTIRSSFNGENLAKTAADRRLKKYRYGAEYISGLKVNYKTGFTLEIGDLVVLDLADLKIVDIKSGTRSGKARMFEIENRTLNLKTGEIVLDLVDTNFSLDTRYALMSPSSLIKSATSSTQFIIKPRSLQQNKQFNENEYFKWNNLIGVSLLVHNDDFSVSGIAELEAVNRNALTVSSGLGFTPVENYHVTLSPYDNQPSVALAKYGFMSDVDFAADEIQYQMI